MSFNEKDVKFYKKLKAEFIPIHPWNRKKDGQAIGKHPLHNDWTLKRYKPDAYKKWIQQGYNLGYRVREDEAILDLDPRNYDGVDVEQKIAELFDCFDFEEIFESWPVVKTGGGGYHIYTKLPFGFDPRNLRETIKDIPGVEVKKLGRQVLTAGCKHPDGKYYEWINKALPSELPEPIIELYKREIKEKKYKNGAGALTGGQLKSMVLDRLDVKDYDSNDSWFPILCGAHHATAGEGIDEFIEWSTSDKSYAGDENIIRNRWESLTDDDDEHNNTVGTLIHELKQNGEETNDLKAAIQFGKQSAAEEDDEDEEATDEEKEDLEYQLIKDAKEMAANINAADLLNEPELEGEIEGKAVEMAESLHSQSSDEELMKCLRLIKISNPLETARAIKIITAKKLLTKGEINDLLKKLEQRVNEDLARVICNKTLEEMFNKGKHIITLPNGTLYVYTKRYWVPVSNEFLGKLILGIIDSLKQTIEIKVKEASLVSEAVSMVRMSVAAMKDRIHGRERPLPLINCKNGELWINEDGSHQLKKHNYKTYQINCLDVNYDPSAECPLFMQTINEIFRDFPDTEDMVRHFGEVMGYLAQPKKNIASWWLLKGPGGDGKSTLLKILGAILKDAYMPADDKLLTKSDNHAMTPLVGKLAVVIEELPTHYMLKDATLKMLSENTELQANPKGKDHFKFTYCGNLVMCSNRYPRSRDSTHAMFRRANIIPFNRTFTDLGIQDINRDEKIVRNREELSGVLNFMLEGIKRLRERGNFDVPQSCIEAKNDWFEESNNVVRFVKDNIEVTKVPSDRVCKFNDLYVERYNRWCEANSIDTSIRLQKSSFALALKDLGLDVRAGTGNQRYVFGGKLKEVQYENEFDDFEDDEDL